MEVKLVVAQGSQAGQEVPIAGRKFFIGRAEDCHLRPHSDLISRHHCVILVEDAFVAVRDFGSKNGTFVNGKRITAEVELKPGDTLKVGQLEFKVLIDVGVGGKKLPKVHSVQEAAVRTAQPPRPQQKAPKDEMDISDWLNDDEGRPMSDTATMDPTQAMGRSGSGSESASAASPSRAEADEEPNREQEDVDSPPARPDANASSRDAAAKGLKHLFRRF
jgi:hypothetical protein